MIQKNMIPAISMQKLKKTFTYFLLSFFCFFASSVFATCASGDQLCSAYATFNDNFGPASTAVYIILGLGALGGVISCLMAHNFKALGTVVVCFLFITVIFAII